MKRTSGIIDVKGEKQIKTAPVNKNGIQVQKISCLEEVNGPNHHTDEYESDALVVRRGSPFYLDIYHEYGYDDKNDVFQLEMKTGKKPKKRNGTLVVAELVDSLSKNEWSFQITSKTENSIRILVMVPVDALVSKYSLTLVSNCEEDGRKYCEEYLLPKPLYILFNPWCTDEEVYMEEEDLKNEYVLNDTGVIYWNGQRPKPWYFGQFTDVALRCVFQMLETVNPRRRDTAREVARVLSSLVNSFDNNGLLAGNWSGDYTGGVKPWEWSGSVAIFKKYLVSGEPVEFGQCWVFSGVFTSIMRTLGIPARSVTNYDSAHDTDNNCTFDKYFDMEMNYLEDESDDSCWNFHVWNDVWMARPDLPAGMGGWQAVDGTPQEESRGIYRCGPASLQAIKEGLVNLGHDTRFIFAEVNASVVYWKADSDSGGKKTYTPVQVEHSTVGNFISTKMPNAWHREDITHQYKYEEGSLRERSAVNNALKKVSSQLVDMDRSVKFSIKVPTNVSPENGIEVVLKAMNRSSDTYTLTTVTTAQIIRYNGVRIRSLSKQKQRNTVHSNDAIELKFNYGAKDYLDDLDENVSIRFSIMSAVMETGQTFVGQKVCSIEKPELEIVAVDNDQIALKGEDSLKVRVTIPSVYGLDNYTDCILNIESPLFLDAAELKFPNLKADGSAVIDSSIKVKKVKKAKSSELIATFNSKEINGITGSVKVDITV